MGDALVAAGRWVLILAGAAVVLTLAALWLVGTLTVFFLKLIAR